MGPDHNVYASWLRLRVRLDCRVLLIALGTLSVFVAGCVPAYQGTARLISVTHNKTPVATLTAVWLSIHESDREIKSIGQYLSGTLLLESGSDQGQFSESDMPRT